MKLERQDLPCSDVPGTTMECLGTGRINSSERIIDVSNGLQIEVYPLYRVMWRDVSVMWRNRKARGDRTFPFMGFRGLPQVRRSKVTQRGTRRC